MLSGRIAIVLTFAAACEPSEAEYVEVARQQVAQNCCVIGKDACHPCPLLEGAHVTWSKVGNSPASSGNDVTVGIDGPHGPGVCKFDIGRMGRALTVGAGHCEPK